MESKFIRRFSLSFLWLTSSPDCPHRAVQDTITRHLIEKGIELHNHAEVITAIVTASNEKVLVCKDGREVAYDEAIWCTQASAQAWLRNTDLDLDQDGFIQVQATLESTNRKGVFACGDICHNVKYPRPKAGVFAVRAG